MSKPIKDYLGCIGWYHYTCEFCGNKFWVKGLVDQPYCSPGCEEFWEKREKRRKNDTENIEQ